MDESHGIFLVLIYMQFSVRMTVEHVDDSNTGESVATPREIIDHSYCDVAYTRFALIPS